MISTSHRLEDKEGTILNALFTVRDKLLSAHFLI